MTCLRYSLVVYICNYLDNNCCDDCTNLDQQIHWSSPLLYKPFCNRFIKYLYQIFWMLLCRNSYEPFAAFVQRNVSSKLRRIFCHLYRHNISFTCSARVVVSASCEPRLNCKLVIWLLRALSCCIVGEQPAVAVTLWSNELKFQRSEETNENALISRGVIG